MRPYVGVLQLPASTAPAGSTRSRP